MQIIATNDTNDPSFLADEQTAINIIDATFTNNISVNIQIGDGDYRGTTLSNQNISEADVNSALCVAESYTTLRSQLLTYGQPGFFNSTNLPSGSSVDGVSNFYISSSVAADFGIFESGFDGFVGIGTGFAPGGVRIDAFLHEICHALGRVPETIGGNNSELDLWRFTNVGQRLFSGTNPDHTFSYFSTDGGTTDTVQWGQNSDSADFRNGFPFTNDPFNETVGDLGQLTATDIQVMEALGFTTPPPPNPPPPAGTTAGMILRDGSGNYEICNIGGNSILFAGSLGQVGTDYAFGGLGTFNGTDTIDMMLRSSSTGAFEIYDISNNNIYGAANMGAVGLEWQVAGFGNFNGTGGGTDMMLRNVNNGGFEVYDVANNAITAAFAIGAVGLDYKVAGFGDFNGDGTTDMMLRSSSTGAFEDYDIQNSHLASAHNMGAVGLDWQVAGFGGFDGDGTSNMMLRNSNSGEFELYDIANNTIVGANAIGAVGLDWQVAGFGPCNGPGTFDMVLRNVNSGAFEVYNIANNQLTGAASLGSVGTNFVFGGIAVDPPSMPLNLAQAISSFTSGGGPSIPATPPQSESLSGALTLASNLLQHQG